MAADRRAHANQVLKGGGVWRDRGEMRGVRGELVDWRGDGVGVIKLGKKGRGRRWDKLGLTYIVLRMPLRKLGLTYIV